MTRPRAADDFRAIRARIEELCGERDQVLAEGNARPIRPRPDFIARVPATACKPGLRRVILKAC